MSRKPDDVKDFYARLQAIADQLTTEIDLTRRTELLEEESEILKAQEEIRGARILRVAGVEDQDWKARLYRTDSKVTGDDGKKIIRFRPSPSNVALALEESKEFCGLLSWDEFAFRANLKSDVTLDLRIRKPITLVSGDMPEESAHDIQSWLEGIDMLRVSKEVVWESIARVTKRQGFHPVREYFLKCKRDHPMEIDAAHQLLCNLWVSYFNARYPACQVAPESPCGECAECIEAVAVQYAGLYWPISAVARILPGKIEGVFTRPDADLPEREFGPGTMVKYVPILIGDQDLGKSFGISSLCPKSEWHNDDEMPMDNSKEFGERARGKLIIELQEIDKHIRGIDSGKLKSAISRRKETFREAYARFSSDHPRQCVMIGTSNKENLLSDLDNTVRFWIIHIDRKIDPGVISRDRDLIWSAAVHLYMEGWQWWPTEEASQVLRRNAETAIDMAVWDERLRSWLEDPEIPQHDLFKWPHTDAFTLEQIINWGIGKEAKAYKSQVITTLKSAGWNPTQFRINGKKCRVWCRPGAKDASQPI